MKTNSISYIGSTAGSACKTSFGDSEMCCRVASACPLCGGKDVAVYHTDVQREYVCCELCHLVYVPEPYHLTPVEEKAVYDLHQNDGDQEGYRKFLSRLEKQLCRKLGENQRMGLDFGCGPGPVLADMLGESGYSMKLYDPFYFRNKEVLSDKFDFICATEVVEHLRRPLQEFDLLFSCLRTGGWLGLMTKMVQDQSAFTKWHYIRDPSHICFFSKPAFSHLADRYGAYMEFAAEDVILMRKVVGTDEEICKVGQ